MVATLEIDGASGEGGGQIVRSSLGLSVVTERPFRITSIRGKRRRPGLLRQHLTAVQAAAEISGARTRGAELGSQELTFEPGPVRAGEYHFDVGSAGSATLVLQTVLPALLRANGPSRLRVEGGTHNPLAPPFDFIERAFLPLLERLGCGVRARLVAHGFYPAGGGCFEVEIVPASSWTPLVLHERGDLRRRMARALVSRLPERIAEAELDVVRRRLGWGRDETRVVVVEGSPGPGNVLLLELGYEEVTEVVSSFGAVRLPARVVGRRAVEQVQEFEPTNVPVGSSLADQLLVPMAVAAGGEFRTVEPTLHTKTNAEVVRRFLDVTVTFEEGAQRDWLVRVPPWKVRNS